MQHFETLDEVIASYPRRFKPEKAEGTDAVIQLTLTGQEERSFYMLIEDGTLEIEDGTHPDPDMTVTAAAEDWLALNNGETNPMTLLMKQKVKFSGSLPMALKFRSMFETAA